MSLDEADLANEKSVIPYKGQTKDLLSRNLRFCLTLNLQSIVRDFI